MSEKQQIPSPVLTVLAPVYNEEENIEPLVEEIDAAVGEMGIPFEILLVDDGSTDSSLTVMRRLQEKYSKMRALAIRPNQGQSAAFAAGFAAAGGEYVVTLDADLQNDPADIPALWEKREEYDLVIGWRRDRKDTWWRRFCSRWANRYRNWKNNETIHDTGCSLKLIPKKIAAKLPVFNGMHRFISTLARMSGATVGEVVVSHRDRVAGVSKYGFWNRAWRGYQDTKGINWLKKRFVRFKTFEYRAGEEPADKVDVCDRFAPVRDNSE